MKVLLVRANRNEVDCDALATVGIDTVIDPYLSITAVPNREGARALVAKLEAPEKKWLVITSQNALEFWRSQLPVGALEHALPEAHAHYAALGARTAALLKNLGAPEVTVPDNNTSQRLADIIAMGPPMPVLLPSGSISMKALPEALPPKGFNVYEEVFYITEATHPAPPSAGKTEQWGIDAVLLRSPSAARAFVEANPLAQDSLSIICGGPTTARHLRKLGWDPALVSPDPEPTTLAHAVAEHFGVPS